MSDKIPVDVFAHHMAASRSILTFEVHQIATQRDSNNNGRITDPHITGEQCVRDTITL